jgi:DNA-binding transcriptional LysR family regulator
LQYTLIDEPIVLWCSVDHPLARKEPLVPEDLEGVPIMCSMELAHPLEESINAMCARRGFKPQYHRFNPTSQASFFFEAPEGCVFLFTAGLKNDERICSRDDMVIRHFDDEDFAVRSTVSVRKDNLSPALEGFCEFLSNENASRERT